MGKALLAAAAFVLAACSEESSREDAAGAGTDRAAEPRPASAEAEICASDNGLLLHVPSPDWRDQVVYMAFVDRFQDGDPTNNDQGFGEYDPTLPTHFIGGDLKGIIDRLDYLQRLGATAIWGTITFFYRGALLGIEDWTGARIYVTTWSSSAEGDYIDIRPEPSQWFFGGGEPRRAEDPG